MSRNVNIDYVRLGVGHGLILGNLPDAVQLSELNNILSKERNMDMDSFGLFEASTPNYTTYYPEVTAEDLKPKDEDFIKPVFRALSGVTVHKRVNPIDFAKNLEVLKKSGKLLKGQTINVDHETATGNAIGAVSDIAWEDSFKQENIVIPAGINAEFKIDGKSNPRIARGIQMDPPSIHSCSVTVEYEWEPSHKFTDANEFYRKLGSYDDKGNQIRRVVTNIRRYHEISVVPHGADPFAQKKTDAGIVNPKFAHITYNSEAEKKISGSYHFMDFKELVNGEFPLDITSNSENPTRPPKNNISENSSTNMNFLTQLRVQLGLPPIPEEQTELTEAEQTEMLAALTALGDNTALTAAQARVTELETEVTGLKANQPNAEATSFMEARLSDMRTELTATYKALHGDKASEAIIANFAKANYESMVILGEQYKTELEAKMPLTCADCSGQNINRASAKAAEEEGGDGPKVPKSSQEVLAELMAKKKIDHANRMHPKD